MKEQLPALLTSYIKNLNRKYSFSILLITLIVIFNSSYSFAQKSNKIAPGFQYLIDAELKKVINQIGIQSKDQLDKERDDASPELYKISNLKGLNPKTGQYEDGYICIIYTKSPEILKAKGIAVQSIYPSFVTAWVTLAQISELADLPEVTFVDLPQLVTPSNDVSVGSSGASLLHNGRLNNTVYKGDGVIVAIVDSGIDWDHPDFRNATDQTKSRILRIWDQTISPIAGENSPTGFSYGVEYTQAQIENEIDGSPANFVREKDTNGHGTHVAGTAAGNGSALTKYTGLAPNADIVVVKGGNGSFTSTNIINSLTYLKNLATTLGKPIVVNMSLGGQFSAHDGTDAQELAVDDFTNSAAGRIAVIAAGNDNGKGIHKQIAIAANGNGTIALAVPTASASTSTDVFQFSLYANDASAISATVTAPDGSTATVNSGSSGPISILGGNATANFANYIDPASGDRKVNLYVVRSNTSTNPAGNWTISLTNMTGNSLTIDGWLNYKGPDFANTSITSGDSNYLVASPGCATTAITVGSYMAKLDWMSSAGSPLGYGSVTQDNISSFSSIGPRRDNVQKPDITANGQAVASCLSSDSNLPNTDSYMVVNGLYRIMQGTSMATPEVAGCVALLLQINNTATFSQIKNAITSTATKDAFTTALNNNTWGNGKIDVFKAASSQSFCEPLNRVTYSYDGSYTSANNYQIDLTSFKAATRFTPDITGQLAGVYFKTGEVLTLTSFTIEVRANTAGAPGALINSLSVSPSSLSKYTWNYFDLSTLNIPITLGTDYFIVLAPGAGSTFSLGNGPASNGRSFYNNGAWTAYNDFRIRSVVYSNTGSVTNTIALSSAAGTNTQTPCINAAITNITYATTGASGATVSGLPTGVTGTWASNVLTIAGTPSASGTFNYTVNLIGGCGTVSTSGAIVVAPLKTITLSSAAGTNAQTPCINAAITNITYATTGANGATVSGLPTGVTGTWASNVLTISGTPSASGTFNYTVNLSGGCGTVSTAGSIVVAPASSVSLTSAAGTNAQTKYLNTTITNITYATTSATGATVSGLPTGVTGTWASNVLTISGTPSVSGTFNYTINLIGGCGTLTTTGSIIVNTPNPIISYSTYDASTGMLVVTGTDFLPLSGVANDIDVTKFSLKGQANGVFTLTSPNVEITSSTSFTIPLNANDKAAVNLLLNNNGPASKDATIYNLAAAEDWNKGIPSSAVIADLINNWIIVSNADQVLPVSLISFKAKSQNNNVLLSWKTLAEHNNSFFRLSHSEDGKIFNLITKVNAAINGAIENTYAFIHLNPVNGNNYYRLEQVDFDGTVKDLGIQMIKFSIAVSQEVKIYPNPTLDDVIVSFEKDFFTEAKLIDLNGAVLIKKSISINDTRLSFDMRNLSAGSYLIQLDGKTTTIKKVVKL